MRSARGNKGNLITLFSCQNKFKTFTLGRKFIKGFKHLFQSGGLSPPFRSIVAVLGIESGDRTDQLRLCGYGFNQPVALLFNGNLIDHKQRGSQDSDDHSCHDGHKKNDPLSGTVSHRLNLESHALILHLAVKPPPVVASKSIAISDQKRGYRVPLKPMSIVQEDGHCIYQALENSRSGALIQPLVLLHLNIDTGWIDRPDIDNHPGITAQAEFDIEDITLFDHLKNHLR